MIKIKLKTSLIDYLRRFLVTFFSLQLLVFSGVVQSATVFEQSPLDGGDGPASFFEEHSADGFTLTTNSSITGIKWWGSFFDDAKSDNSFSISFFNDAGGLPTTNPFQQFDVSATRSGSGLFDLFGAEVFLFSASLTPFDLLANTPYYVSIVHPNDVFEDEFFWLQSDVDGENYTRNINGQFNDWEENLSVSGDLAFSLQGDQVVSNPVPEPNSLLLMSLAVVGFSFLRRRL